MPQYIICVIIAFIATLIANRAGLPHGWLFPTAIIVFTPGCSAFILSGFWYRVAVGLYVANGVDQHRQREDSSLVPMAAELDASALTSVCTKPAKIIKASREIQREWKADK